MPKFITATEARKSLFDLLNEVKKTPTPVHITVHGVPEAVLMSEEDYNAWIATAETLADRALMEAIREGDADIRAGRVFELESVLKDLGYSVAKRKQRNVQSTAVKASSKKPQKTRTISTKNPSRAR